MDRPGTQPTYGHSLLALLATGAPGCAPTVDVGGVYFPGWLVSTVVGVVFSYTVVFWLGTRPASRSLAESGVLFVSLVAGSSLALWWVLFSSF
jgi:hypothetical protein